MEFEDLPFKVVRANGIHEVLARASTLLVGRAAFEKAVTLYPRDQIELRQGGRVIGRSERGG